MNKQCLVIGGNGFIGKNAVLRLLDERYIVYVYDVASTNIKAAFYNKQNLFYIEGDVNNTPYLASFLKEINSVIWLIHTTVPATSMYNVEFDLLSNIPPLIRFIQRMIAHEQIKHFIYLSSGGTVYGNTDQPLPILESYTKNPVSSYGLTKLIAEQYIQFMLKNSPIQTFIIRPSNVYGRFQNLQKPQGLIGHIFKSILSDQAVTVFGDGSIIRDYLHVDDLINAIMICLVKQLEKSPVIFNVGSAKGMSINEMIQKVSDVSGRNVEMVYYPSRPFDCNYNVLAIDQAKQLLGWQPKVTLEEGLKDVWAWISATLK